MQGAQVQSLIEELKSYRLLWGAAKKKIYKGLISGQKCRGCSGCVEHFHEKLDLVNISEIIWSRNVALVGNLFPRSDILVGFKEFPRELDSILRSLPVQKAVTTREAKSLRLLGFSI